MEQLNNPFKQPSRQSRIAIGIILIKFIRTTIRAFWPIALSFFIGRKTGNSFEDYIMYVAIAFAAINLGGSILTFFRFYFHIEEGAIVIDKGVLRRSKTNIPFERIQTINFKQNILHQFFGVVSIEIDTAGAKKSEMTIDALDKEQAMAFRDFVMKEKAELAEEATTEATEVPQHEAPSELIMKLSVSDLFKVGVSQNHLRSMGILFAFVFTTLNELTDNIEEMVFEELSGYEEQILNNTWVLIGATMLLVAIIAFLYSLISTVLKNYDLHLSLQKNGLKLVKGLLNREEISINKKKVQVISWSENPIRRMFNMWTLGLEQASSEDASQLKSKIDVPGAYMQQVEKVITSIFPAEFFRPEEQHAVSKLLMFRIILFLGVFPALIAGGILFYNFQLQALYVLIWPTLVGVLSNLYYKKRSFELNEELLKNNRGTLGHIYELTPIHKIQAVEIRQSWYQRRKALANVKLYTAAGSLSIPFIPLEKAMALEKFVLYRVETDKREWM